MQFKPFTSNNIAKNKVVYPFDSAASIENWDFYTDEQINFNFSSVLSGVSDTKTNNFSQLFLTKRKQLSDFFKVDRLTPIPESFSTFLAFKSTQSTNAGSLYMTADDNVTLSATTAALTIETVTDSLSNQHFFDIEFLDPLLCKISHEHAGVTRYLTVDYTFNLSLAIDAGLSILGPDDPQAFYYLYDDANDLVILYKKILDFPYYVTYSAFGSNCVFIQPPLGPDSAIVSNGVLRMRPHNAVSDFYSLEEHTAWYNRDTTINSLSTDDSLSQTNKENNYLLNVEFSNLTGGNIPINVLTLKNELTPQHNNATESDFFITDQFDYRQYNKIFSGTNQILGDDTISLGYEGYTQSLVFKPDTITYFHAPYSLYPYVQLNINDTPLGQIGAIAADHPVKADKIFKKRGAYGDQSPDGSSSDEANGAFLCAWLSASLDPAVKPIWMDRYYNPSTISFLGALTASNNTGYVTNFSNFDIAPAALADVFDKPSDLYFEPGVYYAYHHLGNTDISNYLLTLTAVTIQNSLHDYFVNNAEAINLGGADEFAFDGQQYSVCGSLSAVQKTNQLTIAFDLNAGNWQSNFANQIVGNYITDGFGVFVQRYITPFIYYFDGPNLYIHNNDGKLVHTVAFHKNIRAVWRLDGLNDYYVLFQDGTVLKNNINDTTIDSIQSYVFTDIINSFYDSKGATFIGVNNGQKQVIYFDFSDNTFTDVSFNANLYTQNSIPLSAVNSIVSYNSGFYGLSSHDVRLHNNEIFYSNGLYEIRKWKLSDSIDYPLFESTTPLRSFNIDKDDNIWLLQDTQFYKYSSTRLPLLSSHYPNASKDAVSINFGNVITQAGEQYYALITTHNYDADSDNKITAYQYSTSGTYLNQFETAAHFANPLTDQNITGDDYVRRVTLSNYLPQTINVRVVLSNIVNAAAKEFNLSYPLNLLGAGYHNFAIRLDGVRGSLALFIDGLEVDEILINPGEYILSNAFERPLIVGATSFYNNTTLPSHLKNTSFYVIDSKIKNFNIYQTAINDFDIKFFANRNQAIPEIYYNIPSGKTAYIEEIERVFKQDVPIKRASAFNIKLVNLGQIPEALQQQLEEAIRAQLASKLPYNAKLAEVKWIN